MAQIPDGVDVSALWPNIFMRREAWAFIDQPVIAALVNVDAETQTPQMARPKNHWRIFLVFSLPNPATGYLGMSASIDMVARGGPRDDKRGILGVVARDYTHSRNAPRMPFPYAFTPGHTLRTVLNFLNNNHLLDYVYHPSGAGCRYWIKTVIECMLEAEIIRPGHGASIAEVTRYLYSDNGVRTVSQISAGNFPNRQ